jgi:hypothetical protein
MDILLDSNLIGYKVTAYLVSINKFYNPHWSIM